MAGGAVGTASEVSPFPDRPFRMPLDELPGEPTDELAAAAAAAATAAATLISSALATLLKFITAKGSFFTQPIAWS